MSGSGCTPFGEISAEGSSEERCGAGSLTLDRSVLAQVSAEFRTPVQSQFCVDVGDPRPGDELVHLTHSEKVDVNDSWQGLVVGIARAHDPFGQFRSERVLKQQPDKKRQTVYECRVQELETRLHVEHERHKSAEQRLQKKIKELEDEQSRKVAEVERCQLQFEQQAIRLEDQENRLTQLMLIIDDTEKTLAPLTNRPSRIQFAHGHPEDKGKCYWVFHKYQPSVMEAIKPNVAGITDEFARKGLISPAMEELLSNSSIPSDTRSEELVKAVQVNLDSNPDNFRKVIGILRGAKDLKCKRLGDRLDHDFHVSEALSSSQC